MFRSYLTLEKLEIFLNLQTEVKVAIIKDNFIIAGELMQLRRRRTAGDAPDPLNLSVKTVVGSKQTQYETECLGICTRAFFIVQETR